MPDPRAVATPVFTLRGVNANAGRRPDLSLPTLTLKFAGACAFVGLVVAFLWRLP